MISSRASRISLACCTAVTCLLPLFGQIKNKPQEKPNATGTAASAKSDFVPAPFLSVAKLQQQIQSEHPWAREERGYKEAFLFWLRQRAYPNDTINWKAYAAAFLQQLSMPRVLLKPSPGFVETVKTRWEFVGPKNLPVPYRQYYGQGTTSGRVNGIAFDPLVDGVLYIATAGGGLWKTTNSGSDWTPLSDGWKNLKTSSVAVDPLHHETVYVGTGDFDGGASVYGYGIQKTTDSGVHWTTSATVELNGLSARRILIDPDNPNVVMVAAGRNPSKAKAGKLLRSENGGDSWQTVSMSKIPGAHLADWEDVKCGAKDPAGKRWCYAVGSSNGGEVLRTADHGMNWEKIRPPISSKYQSSLGVAVSPTDPDVVYLLSGTDELILKSENHGERWHCVTNNFPSKSYDQPNYNWTQSDYDSYIETARNPESQDDIVYVGLIDLVASLDGGKSWVSVGKTYQSEALTHNDQHYLAVNPKDPNRLLIGNDGGVYAVTFDPRCSSWKFDTSLNAGLGLTQFYKMATHPTDPSILLGGAQDNASPASTGDTMNWTNVGGGDGGFSAISAISPEIQYTTTQGLTIYRTSRRWKNWDDTADDCCITYMETVIDKKVPWAGDPTSFIPPITLDPKHQNFLYAGTNYLWRWDEMTQRWSKHLGDQLLAEASAPSVPIDEMDTITTISVAISDSNRIYTASQTGQLWMSTGAGAKGTWRRIDLASSGLPQFWITEIAVHPTNPDTILVTMSGTASRVGEHPGHVWRCTKMSDQPRCQNVSGTKSGELPNIPANTLVIDSNSPDQIYYVGTDIGVFITNNGGTTWGDAGQSLGLPNVQINHLVLQRGSGHLFAATFGRGIWTIKMPVQLTPSNFEMVAQPVSISPTSNAANATERIQKRH